MTCLELMVPAPAVLHPDDTVGHAVIRLVGQGFATLPVVDDGNRLRGLFGLRELTGLLLPGAVRLGEDLGDLGFVSDGPADLRARLGGHNQDPVERHMGEARTVMADTSLVEVLLLLHRGESCLPVVDEDGMVRGIITPAGLAAAIVEAR